MFEWQVKVIRSIYRLGLEVYIYRRNNAGKVEQYFENDTIVTFQDGSAEKKPSFYLYDDMVQPLLDALATAGHTPKTQDFKDGKLQATEKHLEDMRTLVFKKK